MTVRLLGAFGIGAWDDSPVGRPMTVERPEIVSDESIIIEKVKQGDVVAFEALYRAYAGRVYATCLRLSGDKERAEDFTQEIFIRLWTKIDRFAGRSAFSTWLYRLSANLVIDRMRAENRRGQWETTDDELESHPDRENRPSPNVGLAIEEAIGRLPLGARVAFVLHDIEGYQHKEIGDMTGIAAGTSKAQLHRARMLLRKMLR